MIEREGMVLQGRENWLGHARSKVRSSPMGEGPDLANPVAAAPEVWALQGRKQRKGLSYGAALNRAHPEAQVVDFTSSF